MTLHDDDELPRSRADWDGRFETDPTLLERIRQLESDLAETEAAGAARIQELRRELGRGHRYVEGLKDDHRREVVALRQENADRLRAAAAAEAELMRWQTSRLWRLANLYWQARRRLGGGAGPAAAADASAAAAPANPAPGPPGLPESSAPALAVRLAGIPQSFPAQPSGRADVIVFSIIDWDFRFQRPQQIATQLGRQGHRVFFLSTTEFLPPSGPAWELTSKTQGVAELRIRSRRVLDVYEGRLEEDDLEALEEAVAALQEDLVLGDVVSLVEIPFWAPLAERLRRRRGWRVVYDCMDEWANFPGIGREVLALEEGLIAGADVTLATARLLFEKLEGRCRRLVLVPNGVDVEHYRRHYGENRLLDSIPPITPVAHPVLGYYGALASWVDVPLLEAIARRFSAATLVLAGGAFDVDLDAVAALPNVRLLGQRPYADMPRLLWHFDVCIIPFVVNGITEATNPVKFYEYLFSGKPVVAPRLAELVPYADLCYLADGPEDFLVQIERALAEPLDAPVRERRRALAAASDWRERYRALWQAVAESVPLVSVIVVTHGGLPLTRACLESLLQGETWARCEVLVVDNASPDATPAYLRSLAEAEPRLRPILLAENRGFPAANNVGLEQARGEVVLLLNNDTVLPPGLIGRLVCHLERDSGLGLVGACTNFCGNEARVEPGYTDLADLPAFAAARARRHAGQVFDLPAAALYCVAARRAVLAEVGPLDERFGIGLFEDDDYSLRVREAGYRVVCAEDAYVHHVGQGTFRTLAPERYEALWEENRAAFEAKWRRAWTPHRPRPGVTAVASRAGLGAGVGADLGAGE